MRHFDLYCCQKLKLKGIGSGHYMIIQTNQKRDDATHGWKG